MKDLGKIFTWNISDIKANPEPPSAASRTGVSLKLKWLQGPHCEAMQPRGPHKVHNKWSMATFLHKTDKNPVIFAYLLILLAVKGQTEHVDGPHVALKMKVRDPCSRITTS